MVIARKYNFQPGQTIASSQMNEELNQLVNSANNTYTKAESDNNFVSKAGNVSVKPTLYNGWSHNAESNIAFIKTENNLVHVIGACGGGALGRLNLVCYIPEGMLPDRVVYMEVTAPGLNLAPGLLKFQGNRVDVERDLPNAEIFFNLTYKTNG